MKKFSKAFIRKVKDYYQKVEDYDWVKTADHWVGLETPIHKMRELGIKKLVKNYLFADAKVIDVGCGSGLITRHLPKGSVGLDINPRHLSHLKKNAPHVKGLLWDVEKKLPFRSGTFDLAICTEVLEHLIEPKKTLLEIYRILKKEGKLIGSVPSTSFIWKFRFLASISPQRKEPFHHHYQIDQVKKLLSPPFTIKLLEQSFNTMHFYFVVRK